MSAPIATPEDLEAFLGLQPGTINTSRATLFIGWAQARCELIVSPLPDAAASIVLEVAAQGFTRPVAQAQETVGPYSISAGAGGSGLYLSKAQKAALRLTAGRFGAFSIDPLPKGVNAVQSVTFLGSANSGSFTLAFGGVASASIAFDAAPAAVQAALEAITGIGIGNVIVGGVTGSYVVAFRGSLATMPIPELAAVSSLPGVVVQVLTIVKGELSAGQNLAPWNWDYYNSPSTIGQNPGGYL